MRAVVQRVDSAKVEIAGETVGTIGRGLLVYLGVGKEDGDAERDYVLAKILALRVFSPPEAPDGKMDRSVVDIGGALLVVSQFTLYGDIRRGRRPSFDAAMPPDAAEKIYNDFVLQARVRLPVQTGRFGASMKVSSVNDGPVTIWIDTKN